MTRNLIQWQGVWNKIPVEGGQIRHELAGEIVTNWTIAIYPDKNDILTISRNGEYKTVRVISDPEWAVKVMKTQVKASGGAKGLFDLLDRDCSRSTTAFEFKFLEGIWERTKGIN